jgi:hypothetical protein
MRKPIPRHRFEDVPVAVDFRDGGPGVIVTSLRR